MEVLKLMTRLTLASSVSLLAFVGCSKHDSPGSTIAALAQAPPPGAYRVEAMINDYEKVSNECVRVSKKLKNGDVSITMRYLDLEKRIREESAQLEQVSAQMTPDQAKRVAVISARTAPYLQE